MHLVELIENKIIYPQRLKMVNLQDLKNKILSLFIKIDVIQGGLGGVFIDQLQDECGIQIIEFLLKEQETP